ncbi:hypothetical protein AVEN_137326-1 [Araneus ventricosus]|uniref:Uncharacterized protein n=1 Tax=Araneus ventricosus TaxID=182803 RepID=A0A4Y2FIB9_ARAVE|nr:hypothetical protein AVEN_137326-1 [Araneus ventricosus]
MTISLSFYNELPIGLRWPSGKHSALELKTSRLKPDSTEDPPIYGCAMYLACSFDGSIQLRDSVSLILMHGSRPDYPRLWLHPPFPKIERCVTRLLPFPLLRRLPHISLSSS